MVRLILPCMSIEAHGKIGIGIIFATNQWGQYAKFVPKKRITSTPAQKKVRHVYGQIATLWRFMAEEEKKTYHAEAVRNRRTDFNQFFHEVWPEIYLSWNTSILGITILGQAHLGRSLM